MKLAGRSTPEASPAPAITGGGFEMAQGGFLSLVLDCGRQLPGWRPCRPWINDPASRGEAGPTAKRVRLRVPD